MATVSERMESRMGGGVGAFGSQLMTTLWTVEVDAANDDPVQTMWAHKDGPKQGSLFPSNKTPWQSRRDGMVALGFNYARKIAPKVYEVIVTYGPPIFLETYTDAWEIVVSASLAQELRYFDLDGRPIGSLHYTQVESNGGIPAVPQGHDLRKAETPEGDIIWLTSRTAPPNHDSDNPDERQKDKRGRYVTGTVRTSNSGRLTMSRVFPNMPNDVLYVDAASGASAMGTINRVNFDEFRLKVDFGWGSESITLAPAYTCKIAGGTVNKEFGTMLGQREPGAVWRVTFDIEFNPLTWWHYEGHTYPWEGAQLPITTSPQSGGEELIVERHRLYDYMNFTSYFARFQ